MRLFSLLALVSFSFAAQADDLTLMLRYPDIHRDTIGFAYGDPDVEVDNRPDLVIAGRDPQLERGIAILEETLQKQPPVKPKRPPYSTVTP